MLAKRGSFGDGFRVRLDLGKLIGSGRNLRRFQLNNEVPLAVRLYRQSSAFSWTSVVAIGNSWKKTTLRSKGEKRVVLVRKPLNVVVPASSRMVFTPTSCQPPPTLGV